MTHKKSVLNRGLQELMGNLKPVATSVAETVQDITNTSTANNNVIQHISIELLHRSAYQPRRHFDPQGLTELAESIRAQGILQPIIIRKLATSGYEIIAGERRWRAAQQAGLSSVPVIIRDVDDKTAMALALIENMQRQDLSSIDEAVGIQRLINEYGLNHQEIAEILGKSRTTITNLLRLLNLEPEVQQLINEKQLELGHGKVLLALTGQQQKHAAQMVRQQQLSVRATEQLVKRLMRSPKTTVHVGIDPDTEKLQQQLSETLGAPVKLRDLGRGKGELVIKYHTLDELSGILKHIQ